MYLFIFDYELGNIDIVRNVPSDIDDIESFVTDNLGYHITNIEYMLTEDDNIINVIDYNKDEDSLKYKDLFVINKKF